MILLLSKCSWNSASRTPVIILSYYVLMILVVYSEDFNSNIGHLRLTSQKLQQHDVKIKIKQQEVHYINRIVVTDGYIIMNS